MRKLYPIFILLLALTFAGCHGQKKTTTTHSRHQKVDPQKQLAEQLLDAVPVSNTAYASKAKVTISVGSQQISANSSVSMVRDSAIVISVQPLLGIELFRLEISRERIKVIDKMNRRYVNLTYAAVQKETGLNITYPTVQSFFCNQPCVIGQDSDSAILQLPLTAEQTEQGIIMQFTDNDLNYTYTFDSTSKRLRNTLIQMTMRGDNSRVDYSDFQVFNDILFPTNIDISYSSLRLAGSCKVSIQRMQFDGKVDVSSLNTSRYSEVTLRQMLQ